MRRWSRPAGARRSGRVRPPCRGPGSTAGRPGPAPPGRRAGWRRPRRPRRDGARRPRRSRRRLRRRRGGRRRCGRRGGGLRGRAGGRAVARGLALGQPDAGGGGVGPFDPVLLDSPAPCGARAGVGVFSVLAADDPGAAGAAADGVGPGVGPGTVSGSASGRARPSRPPPWPGGTSLVAWSGRTPASGPSAPAPRADAGASGPPEADGGRAAPLPGFGVAGSRPGCWSPVATEPRSGSVRGVGLVVHEVNVSSGRGLRWSAVVRSAARARGRRRRPRRCGPPPAAWRSRPGSSAGPPWSADPPCGPPGPTSGSPRRSR